MTKPQAGLADRVGKKPLLAAAVTVAVLAVAGAFLFRPAAPSQAAAFYDVKRGDFLISVVEGGTLEAVNEVEIRCEVEGTARIIYIVAEGSYVQRGDLLVELDSSSTQDNVNQQQINYEKAQFALVQAERQLEIQTSMVESDVDTAELNVELAQLDLDKYVKGEALQALRNAQIEITNVLETLKISEERLEWSERLYKQGFETKANLDKDRLAVSQGTLKLEQAKQALSLIEKFDQPKRKRELESTLQAAMDNLSRVKLQGDRVLAQYKADVLTQRSTLELNKSKLDRDLKQLQACKIYAPQDGLVVYSGGGGRFSNESMIEEGAVVRNRQELIKLPDVSEMKLQVKIHESHINKIQPGQQAFIVLDSMPDQRFAGLVNRVAPLPDSQSRWSNPNLKVYATEVLVVDPLPNIKPGVSARAEIVVTNLRSVLTVPIQAVTTRKGQQVVFVSDDSTRPMPVSVGMYNNKFIEITAGLNPGDRVLLSPPFDADEKDLSGAIINEGDEFPVSDTNRLARAMERVRETGAKLLHQSGEDPMARRGGLPVDPEALNGLSARERLGDGAPGEPAARPRRGPGGAQEAGSPGRAGGPEREALMKQFDTNGDGQLDDAERAAMRERLGRDREPRRPRTSAESSAQ